MSNTVTVSFNEQNVTLPLDYIRIDGVFGPDYVIAEQAKRINELKAIIARRPARCRGLGDDRTA